MTREEKQELRKALLLGSKEEYSKLKENLSIHYGPEEVSNEEYLMIMEIAQEPGYYGAE